MLATKHVGVGVKVEFNSQPDIMQVISEADQQ